MRAGTIRRPWLGHEDATIKRRVNEGANLAQIARELGRPEGSIHRHWKDIKRRDRGTILHASQPSKLSWAYELGYIQIPPPDYVLRERAIRLAIPPASLSAELLGDPLPGYSARDSKARDLSVQDALEIRALHSAAAGDTITLAKNYGVDQRLIVSVLNGSFFDRLIPSHVHFREWR